MSSLPVRHFSGLAAAVRDYGATVDLINVREVSRSERVQQLAGEIGEAYVASAYDDPLVIEDNASLGDELLALGRRFDAIVVPVEEAV
jgi:threonine dehydratase